MKDKKSVTFRKVNDSDVQIILKWWNDGNIMKHVGFPNGLNVTKADVIQSIERYKYQKEADFLMILDEKGQIIGEFCFRLLRKNIGTFDIKIGEMKKQGQGYGYQSVLQGITYMTQTLTINCV